MGWPKMLRQTADKSARYRITLIIAFIITKSFILGKKKPHTTRAHNGDGDARLKTWERMGSPLLGSLFTTGVPVLSHPNRDNLALGWGHLAWLPAAALGTVFPSKLKA